MIESAHRSPSALACAAGDARVHQHVAERVAQHAREDRPEPEADEIQHQEQQRSRERALARRHQAVRRGDARREVLVPKQMYRNRQMSTSGVLRIMNAAAANGSEMRFEIAGTSTCSADPGAAA